MLLMCEGKKRKRKRRRGSRAEVDDVSNKIQYPFRVAFYLHQNVIYVPNTNDFHFLRSGHFWLSLYFDRLIRSRRSKIKKNDTKSQVKSSFDAHRQLFTSCREIVSNLSLLLFSSSSLSPILLLQREFIHLECSRS